MCESIKIQNKNLQNEELLVSKKGLGTFPVYDKIIPELNCTVVPHVSIQRTNVSRVVGMTQKSAGPLLFQLEPGFFTVTPTNVFPTPIFRVIKTIECLSVKNPKKIYTLIIAI